MVADGDGGESSEPGKKPSRREAQPSALSFTTETTAHTPPPPPETPPCTFTQTHRGAAAQAPGLCGEGVNVEHLCCAAVVSSPEEGSEDGVKTTRRFTPRSA